MLRPLALALALTVCLPLFAACQRPLPPPAAQSTGADWVLRAYDVPPGQADDTRNVVATLMRRGDDEPRLGNVVVAPTGQLLVSAPPAFHDGMRPLIAALASVPTQSPVPIVIDYWIVRGMPGEAKVAPEVPEPAAQALAKFGGGMALSLWDHTRITSTPHERAEVQRRGAKFAQTVAPRGDSVSADIRINSDVGDVSLRAALTLDKPTVLIQAADVGPGSSASTGAVFYVVRASRAQ